MDQNADKLKAGGQSRREFIRKSSLATAAVAASSTLFKTPVYGQAKAAGRAVGANDRIVVGFIGVGGQGHAHVRQMRDHASESNVAQAAVCDLSKNRLASNKEFLGDGCETYQDYRKLLERKDIDAIVCSTVDHWHTRITLDALDAGKHVYVEKPMTRYLTEAFDIYDACKRTGKILQAGSQGCSDLKWHKAAEWIKAGMIGPVVMSQGSYMRNDPQGEWNYAIQGWCTPEDLDWQAWLGPQIARRVDFNPDHYFRWRKYYPYCAGLLGDLFPHKLHPYMLATGNPEFPTRVACLGNRKFETDKKSAGSKKTAFMRDVPEIVQLVAEFPSGMVMHITSSTVNETGTQEMIRGHHATLTMAGNRVELRPERPFADEIDPETSESFQGETLAAHHKDWFRAIRANKQPNAGYDLATKVQTVISLAEMSERLNVMCVFDEKTRKITTGEGTPIDPITYGTLKLS
jgi:predicted dehydrogenase